MNITTLIKQLENILETNGDLRILLDVSGHNYLARTVEVIEGPHGMTHDNKKIYTYDETMVIIE